VPSLAAPDCHHRWALVPGAVPEILDVYGAMIGGMSLAKQSAYAHARKLDELGLATREGRDPITAIVAIVVAVAVALIVAGATIEVGCAEGWWSGGVCDWGWGLLFAGIVLGGIVCVATGSCAFVAQILLHIVI